MQEASLALQDMLLAAAEIELRRQQKAEPANEPASPSRLEAIGRAHASQVRATQGLMRLEIQVDEGRVGRLGEIVRDLTAKHERKASFEQLCAHAVAEQAETVQAVMEEMIELSVDDDAEMADRLLKSLYGALDEISTEEGFSEMPVGQVVARLCRQLDLQPNWPEWAGEDWALSEAKHEWEGSPFCPPPRVVADADGRYRFSAMKPAARETGPP